MLIYIIYVRVIIKSSRGNRNGEGIGKPPTQELDRMRKSHSKVNATAQKPLATVSEHPEAKTKQRRTAK